MVGKNWKITNVINNQIDIQNIKYHTAQMTTAT